MTHRLLRSTLALGAIVALSACSKGNGGPNDSGPTVCTTLADCSGNQVCLASTCVNICHATSECQTSATPNNVCEEGVCLSPACGNDSQCSNGQSCINGACKIELGCQRAESVAALMFPKSVTEAETTVELYKCPHCKSNLRPLRLPKSRGWSGVWHRGSCHALVLVADERHAAPIYVYGSTDWFESKPW